MSSQTTSRTLPRLLELVKPLKIREQNVEFKSKLMENFAKDVKLLSIPHALGRNVTHVGGEKSYMLLGSLAKLERALTRWAMNELVSRHKFTPVVVPNILHDHIIERCGFATKSNRSQVYKISGNNEESILDESAALSSSENRVHSCIAGTSEFALVSIHIGDTIPSEELPKRYCTLSRCYRAETSDSSAEWGLYRVHYFNKVEMVSLTTPDKSEEMHEEFLQIQKSLFSRLNLHFQILDMPEDDLGRSASKKYDIEAWMEARQRFGEISSTSNCKDYQTSRLNIKYSQMIEKDNQLQIENGFLHSVNGTALSSVRTMIALIEQNQLEDGRVEIPEVLVPFMDGATHLPTPADAKALANIEPYPKATGD